MNNLKKCRNKSCNKVKDIVEFNKDKSKKDGLSNICRNCESIKGKVYRDKNKDKQRDKQFQPYNKFANCRKRAKESNLSLTITYDEYKEIIKNPCYYCGDDLSLWKGSSLDRVDNDKGYDIDNVLPCCGDCNRMRSNVLTVKEMKVAIMAVLEYRKRNKDNICMFD